MANNISVGKISGSALCGLCERICVRVKKVTDGCMRREGNVRRENVPLSLSGEVAPSPPYNFVSAQSTLSPEMQNLTVQTLNERRIRVVYDAVFTINVAFTDVYGRTFYAIGKISVPQSAVLQAPDGGREYSIEVNGRLASNMGVVSGNLTLSFNCCVVTTTAIVVTCDAIVPSYGDCVYPECREGENMQCELLFGAPPNN